jgi:hypothetical protein
MQMCQVRYTEVNSMTAHSDCLLPVKNRNILLLHTKLECYYLHCWEYLISASQTSFYDVSLTKTRIFYNSLIEIWK